MTWSNSLLVVPLINSSSLQWRRWQPCDNDSCHFRVHVHWNQSPVLISMRGEAGGGIANVIRLDY
jgi:hypothetical protein